MLAHFLFANDSVLFYKVDFYNDEAIRTALKVNYQKSSLHFDKFVPISLQGTIASILGIHITGVVLGHTLAYLAS